MTSTFTLAHLSDLHLAPVPALSLGQWNVKRGLGFINWRRTRRAVHLPAVAAQIVSDLLAQRPDHIAVTGDLGLDLKYRWEW